MRMIVIEKVIYPPASTVHLNIKLPDFLDTRQSLDQALQHIYVSLDLKIREIMITYYLLCILLLKFRLKIRIRN